MSKGKKVILFMMAIFITLPSSSLKAEYISDARETLRGIKSILVVKGDVGSLSTYYFQNFR